MLFFDLGGRNDFRKKGNKSKLEIVNEVDFIFKVKQKYIKKRNNDAARKIQSILVGRLQRHRYLKERDIKVYCCTRIQCFFRMKQERQRYMRMLAYLYFTSAIKCQKYLRGFIVYKSMKDEKRGITIRIMEGAISDMVHKHQFDLRCRLWPVYKRYIKLKEKKAEIKRKKDMDKMAKDANKKKGYGNRRSTTKSSSMSTVLPAVKPLVKKETEKILTSPEPVTQTP